MATTSRRSISIITSGDYVSSNTYAAANNSAAPPEADVKNLTSGNNTITVPTGGATVKGCTIIPPSGNTTNITLKGVNGDTGIQLHDSDPTSLGIDPTVASFVVSVAADISGVRFVWT